MHRLLRQHAFQRSLIDTSLPPEGPMKIHIATWLAAAALSLVPLESRAVEPLDVFSARIGGYITQFDTQVRADGETTRGTEIDLDRDLDLSQNGAIAYVGLTWRPWERHEFGLGYYQNDSSATRQIQRDITFNGNTYPTQTTLRAESGIDTYEAYYVWWAGANENWALGPPLGPGVVQHGPEPGAHPGRQWQRGQRQPAQVGLRGPAGPEPGRQLALGAGRQFRLAPVGRCRVVLRQCQ
jgi:hypothetical protein